MKEVYRVEGIVNRGFVGQITYMVNLEEPFSKLDIHFVFDASKRKFSPDEITPELIADTVAVCKKNYDLDIDENRARGIILGDMKTEIHTLATLNDEFLGCIHRQMTDRHMFFDGVNGTATEGCIPRERFEGVLKVTVLAFNVIKDGTRYELTVSGE